jgi:aminopeptidase
MYDQRLDLLASLLVNYCVETKPGDVVRINGSVSAADLIRAVYREILQAGGHPLLRLRLDGLDETFYRQASDAQIDFLNDVQRYEVEHIQASIGIWAPGNLRETAGIDPKRLARRSKAMEPLQAPFMKPRDQGGVKWVGLDFPTNGSAQEAGMSLADFEEFVFRACMPESGNPADYWRRVHNEQERLVQILNRVEELHFQGPQMDLRMRCQDRKWINCDGQMNMPDGEIYTAPIDDSAQGWIAFDYPSEYFGKPVEGIRLEFQQGAVVHYSAEKGQDSLQAALEIDEGAKRIGEISFGTNAGIQIGTKNTLFDEKIGGTIHLALGEAYPDAGGINKSAIHWDIVAEMKNGSRVSADGRVIYENGKFLI